MTLAACWRLGANEATTLRNRCRPNDWYSDGAEGLLHDRRGNVGKRPMDVPGELRRRASGAFPYPKDTEIGRTPLTSRTLQTPIESFTIWIIPAADGSPSGELRFAWGSREFSVPWR